MKNACFLPKIAEGWDFGWFGKFHKIIKIGHFLKMKNFFESGFLMSHEGSFPMGVKLSKSKKVYPKCVVAQRLGLLIRPSHNQSACFIGSEYILYEILFKGMETTS